MSSRPLGPRGTSGPGVYRAWHHATADSSYRSAMLSRRDSARRLADRSEVDSRKTRRTKVYWRTAPTVSPRPRQNQAAESRHGRRERRRREGRGQGGNTPETTEDISGDDSQPDDVKAAVGYGTRRRPNRNSATVATAGVPQAVGLSRQRLPGSPRGVHLGGRTRRDRGGQTRRTGDVRHIADETDVLVKADTTGEWTYQADVDGVNGSPPLLASSKVFHEPTRLD